MALQQVQQVAPQDKVKTTSARSGGGKFGSIAGMAGGAALGYAAAAAVPGAAPAALAMGAMGGAGGGAALGGMLGEKVKPGREASTAVERRIQSSGPQMVQSESSQKLRESLMALHQAPPAIKQQYAPDLANAYLSSIGKDRAGGGQV